MLGKQISFYMLPADEAHFINFLFTKKHATFLRCFTHRPTVETLKPQSVVRRRSPNFARILVVPLGFHVSNKALRPREQQRWDKRKLAFQPTGEIRYYVDTTVAPVVEFDRSWLRPDNVLTKGRLYLAVNLIREHLALPQERQLRMWCESIWRWIRKHGRRLEGRTGWFLPEAAKAFQAGQVDPMR